MVVLHAATPYSNPSIPYVPQTPPEVIFKCRIRSDPWVSLCVTHKKTKGKKERVIEQRGRNEYGKGPLAIQRPGPKSFVCGSMVAKRKQHKTERMRHLRFIRKRFFLILYFQIATSQIYFRYLIVIRKNHFNLSRTSKPLSLGHHNCQNPHLWTFSRIISWCLHLN